MVARIASIRGAGMVLDPIVWVSGAMSKFDKEGNLTDDKVRNQLTKYMIGFTDFVSRIKK